MTGELILIVEDNEALSQGLREWLQMVGYQVELAPNGKEGLRRLEARMPDIIISDITMPVMDGFEFFELVRTRPEWTTIPFLFLTARAEKKDVLIGKGLGADDYITKPWGPEELLTAVRVKLKRTQDIALAQLQLAYKDSLTVLANAIESRDAYTRGHVERVSAYAAVIAREMGWTEAQLTDLELGAILHDIGKIAVPEHILGKPGKLTDEEFAEMRKHPETGAFMIRNIPYLAAAIPCIRHHHERYDGEGYPDKLAGEAIPPAARLLTVADMFDAMTSDRPYREGLPVDEGVAAITVESGSHFDPHVVEAFTRACKKGLIAEAHATAG
ncbi:MAG: response regulator [Chloroflexi bacterium]|nr:response regulator [Chloroflexota bacterium]